MREQETREKFDTALRDIAFDLSRIISGDTGAENFLNHVWACWETAEDFRLSHGSYPNHYIIQGLLAPLSPALTEAEKDHVNTIIQIKQRAAREALADERKTARKALADQLRAARGRLEDLEYKIAEAEERCAEYTARAEQDFDRLAIKLSHQDYPVIPKLPNFKPSVQVDGIPNAPGVYFLWSNDLIEYVGKSVKLNQRLRLGTHEKMRDHHQISFLNFNDRILPWAESYYIGIARPPLNFGGYSSNKSLTTPA